MKKFLLLLGSAAVIPMFLLLTAYSGDNVRTSGGIWSNSGSPGDGEDCSACHGGGLNTDNSWMTSDIPATGYIAGQTYTMTLTTTGGGGSAKKGFSVTCEDGSANHMGTFVITDATNTSSFDDHVSHLAAGNTLTTWSFDWTAPASGSGDVTFYASLLFDGYGGGVVNASQMYSEETVSSVNDLAAKNGLKVYPNPVVDQLNIEMPEISGNEVGVTIFSSNGQVVYTNDSYLVNSLSTSSIDVSNLETGMYIINITSENQTFTNRFIVN